MQANVLAEAVCGFHSGAGNVLLHCRAEYGALSAYRPVTDAAGRRPQVGGQIIGASNNPQNGVTAQQTQSVVTFLGSTGPIFWSNFEVEADLQLKDNVVELNGSLFWVTKCEDIEGWHLA